MYTELLTTMFGEKHQVTQTNNVITGYANCAIHKFAIVGIVNQAMLDNQMALDMAGFVLKLLKSKSVPNLLIILDTGGQQVTHKAELLGINRYFAHLAKAIHYARLDGISVYALVSGGALGGAFIATALNAQKIYALPSAQIAVMWLEAMSRVTKVPLAKLQELSQDSPIFAPGAENFYKLGVIESILKIEEFMPRLIQDLGQPASDWQANGYARGGRLYASKVVVEILNA